MRSQRKRDNLSNIWDAGGAMEVESLPGVGLWHRRMGITPEKNSPLIWSSPMWNESLPELLFRRR